MIKVTKIRRLNHRKLNNIFGFVQNLYRFTQVFQNEKGGSSKILKDLSKSHKIHIFHSPFTPILQGRYGRVVTCIKVGGDTPIFGTFDQSVECCMLGPPVAANPMVWNVWDDCGSMLCMARVGNRSCT